MTSVLIVIWDTRKTQEPCRNSQRLYESRFPFSALHLMTDRRSGSSLGFHIQGVMFCHFPCRISFLLMFLTSLYLFLTNFISFICSLFLSSLAMTTISVSKHRQCPSIMLDNGHFATNGSCLGLFWNIFLSSRIQMCALGFDCLSLADPNFWHVSFNWSR